MTKLNNIVEEKAFLPPSVLLVLVICLVIFGGKLACGQNTNNPAYPGNPSQTANVMPGDDSQAIAAQTDHAIRQEITVVAKVKKLLPEDVVGLPHQKFLIVLSNGTTVLIAHDLKMAPAVPIKPGDVLCIHGEYIWNKLGGLIHWTHHTDTPRHEGGWIDFNGVRYQ